MVYSLPQDMVGGWLLAIFGFGIFVILGLLGIVLIEAFVLQRLKWGTFGQSLKASLLMNFVSTVIGFFSVSIMSVLGFAGLVIAWILSVIIEGCVLMGINKNGDRLNWKVAIAANAASYILFLPLFLMASGFSGGLN